MDAIALACEPRDRSGEHGTDRDEDALPCPVRVTRPCVWRRKVASAALALGMLVLMPQSGATEFRQLDLGGVAADGKAAARGVDRRANLIINRLACQEEFAFLKRLDGAIFKNDWPTEQLHAKAQRAFEDPRWDVWDEQHYGTHHPLPGGQLHAGATRDVDVAPLSQQHLAAAALAPLRCSAEYLADAFSSIDPSLTSPESLNRYYLNRFGDACDNLFSPNPNNGNELLLSLPRACMMAQVRYTVAHADNYPWAAGDHQRVDIYPGTEGLPCLPKGKLKLEGDWDMEVIAYVRLANLVERAKEVNPELAADADLALQAMDLKLLTLKGWPAKTQYNVLLDCGNAGHAPGDGADLLGQGGSPGGSSGYGAGDSGDTGSWLPDLLKWLLLILLAIIAGAIIAGLLGAGAALFGGGIGTLLTLLGLTAAALLATLATLNAAIPETENHLLMQNSSIYLTNRRVMSQAARAGARDQYEAYAAMNRLVRERLVTQIGKIAREDFNEYNSKPYGRLSHYSLLNLADYACSEPATWIVAQAGDKHGSSCDPADANVATLARAVLDLSAAKAALGSSQSRRLVPFRRLMDANKRYRDFLQSSASSDERDWPRILQLGAGADHLVAALQFWTGDSRQGPGGQATGASLQQMSWHATSSYRPHALLLDLATDARPSVEQTLTHGGHERFSSGSRWLLSAGGTRTRLSNGLILLNEIPLLDDFLTGMSGQEWNGIELFACIPSLGLCPREQDSGAGVPTTLMVSAALPPEAQADAPKEHHRRDTYRDLLRFEGRYDVDESSNNLSMSDNRCVAAGFACGRNLRIPEPIASCLQAGPAGSPANLRFLSSTRCAEYHNGTESTADDFYLAVYAACPAGQTACRDAPWGFLEVANATAFGGSFEQYKARVVQRNQAHAGLWAASNGEQRLVFESVTRHHNVQFTPFNEDFDADCRACGHIIQHEGGARFILKNPNPAYASQSILIDASDPGATVRHGTGGLLLEH